MKDKGIDNGLLKDIETDSPLFRGFQSIRKLFWKYLNLLGVPFNDPCCPGASTASPGGSSIPLDITDDVEVTIAQDKFLAFNGVPVGEGELQRTPNFTISGDENDMWIGTEFYDGSGNSADWFHDYDQSDMLIRQSGVIVGRCKISSSAVFLYKQTSGEATKLGVTGTAIEVDDVPGVSGTFTSNDGKTITVTKGIITAIDFI